jgi:hypothetical protein
LVSTKPVAGASVSVVAMPQSSRQKRDQRQAPFTERLLWDWLLDQVIAARLGILDWLTPLPETPVDRAIREEGERLRKAFP